jgi:arabinogalactan endo-1,4-beta-galactosidase
LGKSLFSELLEDVYAHTYDVIDALKVAGVTPEWVQVGNEIQAE